MRILCPDFMSSRISFPGFPIAFAITGMHPKAAGSLSPVQGQDRLRPCLVLPLGQSPIPEIVGALVISPEGSVTQWIAGLKAGEGLAAEQLWQEYFQRLVGLAHQRLGAGARRAADEEDVAISAFKSLCVGAVSGRFPQLRDRDNLWPLLVILTVRKAQDLVKYEHRLKRGGGQVPQPTTEQHGSLDALLSSEPSPELSAMVAENCARLLDRLEPVPRQIAQCKLEGHTNAEIAERLGCGLRTIERRLELIRRLWEQQS